MKLSSSPKLLILTPAATVHGGVERIVEALNDGLPSRGFEVVVGLAKGARFHDTQKYRRAYPSLRVIELDASTGTPEGRRRAVQVAINRVRPDVVLIARMASAFEVLAERKLGENGVRTVMAIRTYESDYFVDLARFGSFVDYCIADGELVAGAAAQLCGLPRERIRNVPGGILPATTFVRRQPAPGIRLGYVGRLEAEQKRILDLPGILARLRERGVEFSCVIAGEGPAEAALRGNVQVLGLSDRIQFVGACEHETLYRDIYPNIEVFLHCAAWEGVTIAPREAMAHGAVPVVSLFTGLRQEGVFLNGINCRTFPVADTGRAADIIAELARDQEQWKRLSDSARQSQEGIRSYEGALDAWAECFRRVLEFPQRRGAAVPAIAGPPVGRLDRFLGEKKAETVRRLLGRKYRHAEQGGEWPHWTGVDDPELRRRVEEFARQIEDRPAPVGATS